MWSFACVFGEMLNGAPLFPGSNDLHQISKISEYLGSPTPDNWPNIVNTPNYNKIMFDDKSPVDLSEIFLDSSRNEIDLLSSVLRYQDRQDSHSLLQSQYFHEYPPPLSKLLPEEKYDDIPFTKYEDIFNVT